MRVRRGVIRCEHLHRYYRADSLGHRLKKLGGFAATLKICDDDDAVGPRSTGSRRTRKEVCARCKTDHLVELVVGVRDRPGAGGNVYAARSPRRVAIRQRAPCDASREYSRSYGACWKSCGPAGLRRKRSPCTGIGKG